MKIPFKRYVTLAFVILLLSGCNSIFDSSSQVEVTPEMNEVITNYIIDKYKEVYPPSDRYFEVHKVYGAKEAGEITSVYMYSLYLGFNKETKTKAQSGHSLPALVKLKKEDGKYVVTYYKEPEDGTRYKDSIYKMFPRKYASKAMDDTGNIRGLEDEIQKNVEEWLSN